MRVADLAARMEEVGLPRTLTQLKSRVAQAMAEADDADAMLDLIREAVRTYGFDAEDIFGKPETKPALRLVSKASVQRNSEVQRKPKVMKIPQAPFADAHGNTWSGKGRHPNWLVAELARGASVEQFSTARTRKEAGAGKKKPGRRKAEPLPPYGDAEGNMWSGRGRRPNWLNAALDSGYTLEDFRTEDR